MALAHAGASGCLDSRSRYIEKLSLMVELKFDDPDEVVTCADGPWRNVPGFSSLLTMTLMLLAGPVPDDVWVLVIGEVGGLELAEFAQATWIGISTASIRARRCAVSRYVDWGRCRSAVCRLRVGSGRIGSASRDHDARLQRPAPRQTWRRHCSVSGRTASVGHWLFAAIRSHWPEPAFGVSIERAAPDSAARWRGESSPAQ